MANNTNNTITFNTKTSEEVNTNSTLWFALDMIKKGYRLCVPSYNGEEMLPLSFTYRNDDELKEQQEIVTNLLKNTKGSMGQMRNCIMDMFNVMKSDAIDSSLDEVVIHNGVEYLISYKNKTLYDKEGNVVVELDEDLKSESMSKDLVQKLLYRELDK